MPLVPCVMRARASGRDGATTRTMRAIVIVFLILAARPAGAGELPDFERHVRVTDDVDLRDLIREAMATSPSFRALVARLMQSDVIVYVIRERTLPSYLDGQISLMAVSGGKRYLAVRVSADRTPRRLAGIIAHELQHAVEIADAPRVVSAQTLAAEFERMGDRGSLYGIGLAKTYETDAAILAGQQARREYGSRNSQLPAPRKPPPEA